ncbi:cytochrome c oxidase subunit II [Acidimicrobiaceae bacterium USS-CC1]|uniref:Cytochrome aa3 subunit 2 n=1 Tax=Acidiferrimicrobium australe TaxID=2664430 RepID=A0ABW9QRP8_9ACTN|nr:cytochrome c oxidase subunit II [Acidiferrimicrobium australe]
MLREAGPGGNDGPVGQGGRFGDSLNSRHVFGHVFGIEVVIACVVFGAVLGLIVLAGIWSHHKRRNGQEPWRKSEHHLVEGTYTVVLAGVTAFIVFLSFTSNAKPAHVPPAKVGVYVTAYQWCWRFTYQGTGVSITATCEDGHVPTLELPTHTVVHMSLISADVVHEMWVPHLRFKMEAFPDHVNAWDTELYSTGTWPGRCSEFCGIYHYAMHFYLKAVTPATFTTWLHGEQAKLHSGHTLAGNSGEALP